MDAYESFLRQPGSERRHVAESFSLDRSPKHCDAFSVACDYDGAHFGPRDITSCAIGEQRLHAVAPVKVRHNGVDRRFYWRAHPFVRAAVGESEHDTFELSIIESDCGDAKQLHSGLQGLSEPILAGPRGYRKADQDESVMHPAAASLNGHCSAAGAGLTLAEVRSFPKKAAALFEGAAA